MAMENQCPCVISQSTQIHPVNVNGFWTNCNYGVQFVPCIGDDICGLSFSTVQPKLLLLSGDIETNPGPTSDTQLILGAINDCKAELSSEIIALRQDVSVIQQDLKNVKSEVHSLKGKIDTVESQQRRCVERIKTIDKKIDAVEYDKQVIQGDIQEIGFSLERESGRMEYLEQQMIMMDAESVKDSLRVFGLSENESETSSLEDLLDTEVFSVMDEGDRVAKSNISAKRVGSKTGDKVRMVVVKFVNVDEKFKIFKYRESLREKGIRVSNALGAIQRQIIRDENAKGYRAYFKSGKLYTELMVNNQNTNRRGVRTLDDRNREQLRNRETSDFDINPNTVPTDLPANTAGV